MAHVAVETTTEVRSDRREVREGFLLKVVIGGVLGVPADESQGLEWKKGIPVVNRLGLVCHG